MAAELRVSPTCLQIAESYQRREYIRIDSADSQKSRSPKRKRKGGEKMNTDISDLV